MYYSYQIAVGDRSQIFGKELDEGTNNRAEYLSAIAALKHIAYNLRGAELDPADFTVSVQMDSKLVVNQVTPKPSGVGYVWKCKQPELRKLHRQLTGLMGEFQGVTFQWVPRAMIEAILGH
jgi:ribonuclease HI